MVDKRIATGAEQPIHSDGAVSTVTLSEADLVGLDGNGELVAADAASGSKVPAVGVSAVPVDDPSNYPTGQFEYAAKTAEANRKAINDGKVGYVKYGVEITNEDDDWGFTQGEPVYLDTGGGFTQTKPSGTNELVQVVGEAIEDGEAIILDISPDWHEITENSGDATFSGTGSKTGFDIAHSLSSAPSRYNVEATSADADGDYHVAVDGTNITVKFGSAPADATDNVTFNWYAEE